MRLMARTVSQSSNRRRQSRYTLRSSGKRTAIRSRPVRAAIATAGIRLGRSASSHVRACSWPANMPGTGVPGSARRCALAARTLQVVGQHPAYGLLQIPGPASVWVELAGIQAQQVMHPPPARPGGSAR